MNDPKQETSAGGSTIYRHEAREAEWVVPTMSANIQEIEHHFATHFGEVSSVFHEIVSDLIHIDVHIIKPQPERPWWTLFTTGMSDLPMTTPEGQDDSRHAELMIKLPRDWRVDLLQLTPPSPELDQWYWPIMWLKKLARFPHEYKTWLGMGHTIPNGDPAKPFAPGTRLCCWLLLPPVGCEPAARSVPLSDGRTVNLYVLHALHPEEVTLKLVKGTGAVLDLFDRKGVREILDPRRESVVRKKLWGLF